MKPKYRKPLLRIRDALGYMTTVLSQGCENGMDRQGLEEFCYYIANLLSGKDLKNDR